MEREPLGKWISIIYRHSMMHANEQLKRYKITGSQLIFFIAIVDMAGITQEELSDYLKINKSTTTKAIKSLEKNGYINRIISKKDARAYNLYPTKKATELRKKIRDLAFEWDNILIEGFNEQEKKHIYKLIELMADNVVKYINKKR